MQTHIGNPHTQSEVAIDAARLLDELNTLATFTSVEPSPLGTAVTRVVFTSDDLRARAWLTSLAAEAGLQHSRRRRRQHLLPLGRRRARSPRRRHRLPHRRHPPRRHVRRHRRRPRRPRGHPRPPAQRPASPPFHRTGPAHLRRAHPLRHRLSRQPAALRHPGPRPRRRPPRRTARPRRRNPRPGPRRRRLHRLALQRAPAQRPLPRLG